MYLNFQEISGQIQFIDLLNHLNIPFKESKSELKTERAVINKNKNLFFYKGTKKGGSVINFYSDHASCSLREAGEYLVKIFIKPAPERKREIPDLELKYNSWLEQRGISEETAKELEIGFVKQRSVMSGKIAFIVRDENGNKVGYVGKEVKKDGWFNPKGLRISDYVYNRHRVKTDYAILADSPLSVAYLHSQGFDYAVGLFGKSASDKQIEALQTYKRIIVIHPEPENIVLRLSNRSFIRYHRNSATRMTCEEIKHIF